jgi:hypothetical protein
MSPGLSLFYQTARYHIPEADVYIANSRKRIFLFPLNVYQKSKIAASIDKGKQFSSTLKMEASFFWNTCTLVQTKDAAHKKDSNATNAVRITDVKDMANTERKFLCIRRQMRTALFLTDVSEQPICPILQGQEIQEESFLLWLLDLFLGGSLKSRKGGKYSGITLDVDFSIDIILHDRTMALGSTQPLTGMSTRSISWG